MRWTPTRGPQDPWTPRKIALRGHLFAPYPRRPTVDGAPPKVHLHNFYDGVGRPGPPLTGRRTRWVSISVRTGRMVRWVSMAFTLAAKGRGGFHAAWSAIYEKVSLSSVGEDH